MYSIYQTNVVNYPYKNPSAGVLTSVDYNRLRQGTDSVHCKNRLAIFPSPSGRSFSLAGNNYFRPGRVWLVIPRLGTGKSLTFFTMQYMLAEL
jgi:hypothetical protein